MLGARRNGASLCLFSVLCFTRGIALPDGKNSKPVILNAVKDPE